MTKNDAVIIGCRFFALYWLITALYSLLLFSVGWFELWNSPDETVQKTKSFLIYASLLPFLLHIFIAGLFWFGANKIAGIILPRSENSEYTFHITLQEIQAVAFSAIGLYLLVTAIPDLSKALYFINLKQEFDRGSGLDFNTKSTIFREILKLVLGIVLLFGARGLSGVLKGIRELGNK